MRIASLLRSPAAPLVFGFSLLLASVAGWAWLHYDLYREEEAVLEELHIAGHTFAFARGPFLAQASGDQSDGVWEIATETYRADFDEAFPWLRPLEDLYVHQAVSPELEKRIAELPRPKSVMLTNAVVDPSVPTPKQLRLDPSQLPQAVLPTSAIDQPLPSGKTVLEGELPELEQTVLGAWERASPLPERYEMTFVATAGWRTFRLAVDGEKRAFFLTYPGGLEVQTLGKEGWTSVVTGQGSFVSVERESRGDEDYAGSVPDAPFVAPLRGYGSASVRRKELAQPKLEYAERLADGRWLLEFAPFPGNVEGHPQTQNLTVESLKVVANEKLDWCVERADWLEVADKHSARYQIFNQLERRGEQIVLTEQFFRYSYPKETPDPTGLTSTHIVLDWNFDPKFAADEFEPSRYGAGRLADRPSIAWHRRWFLATLLLGWGFVLLGGGMLARRAFWRKRSPRQEAVTAAPAASEAA